MGADSIKTLEYDTNASIYLRDDQGALVVGPDKIDLILPKMDDDAEVPSYLLLLSALAALLSVDEFVTEILEEFGDMIEQVA